MFAFTTTTLKAECAATVARLSSGCMPVCSYRRCGRGLTAAPRLQFCCGRGSMDGRGLEISGSAHWNAKQYTCSERSNKNQAVAAPNAVRGGFSVVGVVCHATAQRAVVVRYPLLLHKAGCKPGTSVFCCPNYIDDDAFLDCSHDDNIICSSTVYSYFIL